MNKKAHSNYLKLFLVFLVIFGVIGGVVGAEFTDNSGNKVKGIIFAKVKTPSDPNGKILVKSFVLTKNQYDGEEKLSWDIYEIDVNDPNKVKLISIGDPNNGNNYLRSLIKIESITIEDPSGIPINPQTIIALTPNYAEPTSVDDTSTQVSRSSNNPSVSKEELQKACILLGLNCEQTSNSQDSGLIKSDTLAPNGCRVKTEEGCSVYEEPQILGACEDSKCAIYNPSTGETISLSETEFVEFIEIPEIKEKINAGYFNIKGISLEGNGGSLIQVSDSSSSSNLEIESNDRTTATPTTLPSTSSPTPDKTAKIEIDCSFFEFCWGKKTLIASYDSKGFVTISDDKGNPVSSADAAALLGQATSRQYTTIEDLILDAVKNKKETTIEIGNAVLKSDLKSKLTENEIKNLLYLSPNIMASRDGTFLSETDPLSNERKTYIINSDGTLSAASINSQSGKPEINPKDSKFEIKNGKIVEVKSDTTEPKTSDTAKSPSQTLTSSDLNPANSASNMITSDCAKGDCIGIDSDNIVEGRIEKNSDGTYTFIDGENRFKFKCDSNYNCNLNIYGNNEEYVSRLFILAMSTQNRQIRYVPSSSEEENKPNKLDTPADSGYKDTLKHDLKTNSIQICQYDSTTCEKIEISKLLATNIDIYSITEEDKAKLEKIKSYSNNPMDTSLTSEDLKLMSQLNVPIASSAWTSIYTNLPTLNSNYLTAQTNYNTQCSTNSKIEGCLELKATLDNAKKKLENTNNLIEQRGDISSALNSMTEDVRKIFMENYNKNKCGDGWTSSICKMFNQETVESLALQNYNKKIEALNSGQGTDIYKLALSNVKEKENEIKSKCGDPNSNDCKTANNELKKAKEKQIELYNKELSLILINSLGADNAEGGLKNTIIASGKCSQSINSECVDIIKNFNCNGDKNCEQIQKNTLKSAQSGYLKTQVETNIGYDILTAILSPDQNAMSAAKLFGVEADYSNVPKFLSESIPSQICLAKIDGYLDKTKESSINGQGGLTSYGCSQEYTQVYDEETKKYKKMPQTQCLEVLADLRAQRTQMTPDGKTAISYSYYIKAPPSTELKYIVAISYVEGSTIKKQTIVPLTKTSGIKNGFDSVELFLNASENGEINENSFTINLLAIYENNEVYQKLSYSIPPITTGDSYSTPIPAQVASSNGANSGSSSNQNVKAELSTEDMLAMI